MHESMILIFHRTFQRFDELGVIILLYHRNRVRMNNLLEVMDNLFSRVGILDPNPVDLLKNLQITLLF